MLANPKPGQPVKLAYAKPKRKFFHLHGRTGVVVAAGKGKPRNHLIRLDTGELVVVPCGHLLAEAAP